MPKISDRSPLNHDCAALFGVPIGRDIRMAAVAHASAVMMAITALQRLVTGSEKFTPIIGKKVAAVCGKNAFCK